MRKIERFKTAFVVPMLLLLLAASVQSAAAQSRRSSIGGLDDRINNFVDVKVSELTLEAINFRDQTARLNLGLDITNPYIPVKLKDFGYRLSLFNQPTIEGQQNGTLRLGGRNGAHVDLPVVVNLRAIPEVLWSAFSNRGNVRYQLDTDFSVPLLFFSKHVNQSFAGEVPLRSLVDAASILRARNLSGIGGILTNRW